MTTTIIITLCTLLLLAYVFDISASVTRIPSVILLLVLGILFRQVTNWFEISFPDLNPLLPVFGTVGLILIVMEGALDIELNRNKFPLIKKALFNAIVQMIVLAVLIALALHYFMQADFQKALINALPLCIISSTVAISSVRNLANRDKEFVVYESSMSDILGVLVFNFLTLNHKINFGAFTKFSFQLIVIILISFVAVLSLSYMLSRIKHHIRYAPIILLAILIYALSKIYHLPGLLFILVFGLFLGNLDEIRHVRWIEKLKPDKLNVEVQKFKDITFEATFLIRSLFFILFGFLIQPEEILNGGSLIWSSAIVVAIILVRWIVLKISQVPVVPLLFVAPRGLITILLFLSVTPDFSLGIVGKSMIIQTILLTVLVLIIGMIVKTKHGLSG